MPFTIFGLKTNKSKRTRNTMFLPIAAIVWQTIARFVRKPSVGYRHGARIFPKLGQRLSQQAGTLSGGERKMLAIGRALLSRPRLLLHEEPTEGVWVGVIEEIAERLAQLTREMSVVLVEQHVELALRLTDYAYVMDRGNFPLEGPAKQIRGDPRLLRYLAP
jgi:branched-chain amino acid transport system ATP-binding protein